MKSTYFIASIAAISLGGYLLARQEAPVAPAASTPPAQPGTLEQARWFSSLPGPAPGFAGAGGRSAERKPAVGRNGRAIDLGGLSAAQYIGTRIGAARAGDVKAAYEVYQAESMCAANDDPIADFGDPLQRAQFLREREASVKLCAGLTPAQVQERLGFLGAAARAGKLDAQIDFYMEGPYGRAFDMQQNLDDPTVKQWKQDALGYLKNAGRNCDHFALALLSTVYDAGQLTERDLSMSMAYSIAAAVPRKKPLTEQQLRDRFGEELSAPEFDGARQLGAQLGTTACPPP